MHKRNEKPFFEKYYQIGNLHIRVIASIPFVDNAFHPRFKDFESAKSDQIDITLKLHFELPELHQLTGQIFWNQNPWILIKTHQDRNILLPQHLCKQTMKEGKKKKVSIKVNFNKGDVVSQLFAIISDDRETWDIYLAPDLDWRKNQPLNMLSGLFTDQIWLAEILGYHQNLLLHSAGVVKNGLGFSIIGQSNTGKSAMIKYFNDHSANIDAVLSDEKIMIYQSSPHNWQISGTWVNGELLISSSRTAPLQAVLFLDPSNSAEIIQIRDKNAIIKAIISCTTQSFGQRQWWQETLTTIEKLSKTIPFYRVPIGQPAMILSIIQHHL
jgi:hypothetical protein